MSVEKDRRMYFQISAEFIELFQFEPCLWDIRCRERDSYNMRMREAAIARIVERLSATQPGITTEIVRKEIKYMKRIYGQERRKLLLSINSGTEYKPKLWYFDLLRFLDDQLSPNTSNNSEINDDDTDSMEGAKEGDNSENILGMEEVLAPEVLLRESDSSRNSDVSTPSIREVFSLKPEMHSPEMPSNHLQNKNIQGNGQEFPGTEVLQPVEFKHNVLYNPLYSTDEEPKYYHKMLPAYEDRHEIYGKSIAIRMRGLQKQQMLLAERMINETLFQAELGCLNMNHRLIDIAAPQQYPPRQHSHISPQHSHISPQHSHISQQHSHISPQYAHAQFLKSIYQNLPRKTAP